MVTRSDINYPQHLIDVEEWVRERYSKDPTKPKKFIALYKNRYDKHQQSYIDYRLAVALMEDYAYVRKKGTRWYALVGEGGTGKTTLAKNIGYFFDDTLTLERVNMSMISFVKSMDDQKTVAAQKAIILDEPDEDISANSQLGHKLKAILGKARQQRLYLIFCATDLKDIPPYIFRKINGVFFLPYLGKAMYFKNRPRKFMYPLQVLRENYGKKGYGIFKELERKYRPIKFDTKAGVPLTYKDEKKYLEIKEQDYKQSQQDFIKLWEKKHGNRPKEDTRLNIILNMKNKGLKLKEIAEFIGLSEGRISQILANKV